MKVELLTKEDLQLFSKELLSHVDQLLQKYTPDRKALIEETMKHHDNRWMKSKAVRNMLNISDSTLQNVRRNGQLPFTKVGGVILYDKNDVEILLQQNLRNKQML